MSSGSPIRPSGTLPAIAARVCGSFSAKAIILLSNGPGAMALTVIDSAASLLARCRVSMCTPALLAL
jgi:hypothetical protein